MSAPIGIVFAWRELTKAIIEAKRDAFPNPCPVSVACQQYSGYGVAVMQDGEPPDKLTVMLENGNAWQYPVESCIRVQWRGVDAATRRFWLRRRGYRCPPMNGPRRDLP